MFSENRKTKQQAGDGMQNPVQLSIVHVFYSTLRYKNKAHTQNGVT